MEEVLKVRLFGVSADGQREWGGPGSDRMVTPARVSFALRFCCKGWIDELHFTREEDRLVVFSRSRIDRDVIRAVLAKLAEEVEIIEGDLSPLGLATPPA